MLVELPTVMINSPLAGAVDNYVDKFNGLMLLDSEHIQNVFENGIDGQSGLEAINGSVYTIRISYVDMKKLWFKLVTLKDKCDFVTYSEEDVEFAKKESSEPAMKMNEEFIDSVIDGNNEYSKKGCSCCGGLNFGLPKTDGTFDINLKKCMDCGLIQEVK